MAVKKGTRLNRSRCLYTSDDGIACAAPVSRGGLCREHDIGFSARCSSEACMRPVKALGLCTAHYKRLQRNRERGKRQKQASVDTPVRRVDVELVPILLRVERGAYEVIEEAAREAPDGTAYRLSVDILERWAKKRRAGQHREVRA